MPHHLLPSLREARAQGRPHRLLTLALAGWLQYLRGRDERGAPLVVDDPLAERLQALARAGGTDPRPVLGLRSVFGDLADDDAFVTELRETLERLASDGVRACLAAGTAVPLR
jgi:fructuronate reductase/mannitol 2-dehydrogenase